MSRDIEILLAKWIEGSLSPEEHEWLNNQYDLNSLRLVLAEQERTDIDLKGNPAIWKEIEPKLKKRSYFSKTTRRAFIFIGLLFWLVAFFLYQNHSESIRTNVTEQKTHQFADNTKVIVAPDSKLVFNESKWSEERKLKLQGQAHFEVTEGSKFIVETHDATITVLGTEFEIWQSGDAMRISCFEGSVSVANKESKSVILKAGDKVELTNRIISEVKKHGESTSSFLSGRQKYGKIPIASLVSEIQRFYGLSVDFDYLPKKKNYSGVLILDDIDEAMKVIATSMNWKYEIEKNQIKIKTK